MINAREFPRRADPQAYAPMEDLIGKILPGRPLDTSRRSTYRMHIHGRAVEVQG